MPGHYISEIWQSNPTIYAPAKFKRACRYDSFIPDELGSPAVSLPAEVAGLAAEADAAIRALNSAAQPALAPLARLLLRTESIASSKVEGLQMGVRELARAEARMETGGRRSQTAAEVLANMAAMETAITEAAAVPQFGTPEILEIHRRLMEHDTTPRTAGQMRPTQNWIGGNDYNPCGADLVPPPPELVDALLEDVCEAIDDDSTAPLVQAALVHAQFETIHPFDDGNGRTGRTLIHVVLRRRGVTQSYVPPISVLFARDRERYVAGLTAYRHGEVEAWVEQFATAAARAATLARSYVRATGALQGRWRTQLSEHAAPRADAAAWSIIDVLPAHPVITGPVAGAATGRAKAAIYAALEQLEDAGVLHALSGGRRNRSWEAVGLLDLVAQLEEGEESPAEPK
jgi:Fic family protein